MAEKRKTFTHCQRKACGKEKRIPETNYMPREVYEEDPYCSRACKELDLGIKTEEELVTRA